MTDRPEVAVLAGSGKTGRALARALADAGARTRPLGRADLADPVAALRGCAAAYVMAPNLHPDEASYVGGWLAAARRAGVARVVHHSVASPYVATMPHHLAKAVSEDLVRRSGLSWTLLQPCAYVQNLLPGLRADRPLLRVPYDPDRPFGLVDLLDVAQAAARVLLDPVSGVHEGATYELGGPRLVSVRDVAAVAARVLGADVAVERVPAAVAVAGLDEREATWLTAMFAYYDEHGLPTGGRSLAAVLGREPHALPATLARELAESS
ncbi:NmrA family NAD(P)-binding protein [Nocardioides psychrotolerans]|uniref:SDR family oxidoreductase n=1 Tax=Nocardioides psychrotolerans TaxID=1005945 RepID=UPI003138022C